MAKLPAKLIYNTPKKSRINRLKKELLPQLLLLLIVISVAIILHYFFLFLRNHHLITLNINYITEILLIGAFIIFSNRIRDRNKRIDRYIEELEKVHTLGARKGAIILKILLTRLTAEKFHDTLSLNDLHTIRNEIFQDIKLSVSLYNITGENIEIKNSTLGSGNKFTFHNVRITHSKLSSIAFEKGEFYNVFFSDTLFDNCWLRNNSFTSLQFDHAQLWKIRFVGCLFRNPVRLNLGKQGVESMDLMATSGFICSRLENCIFQDVHFEGIDFTGAGLIDCRFSNVSGLKASDFYHVITLYKTVLPEEIDQSLRNSHPQLFEKPQH